MSKVFRFGLLMVSLLFGVAMISCNDSGGGLSDGVIIDVDESSSSTETVSSSSVASSSSSSGTANSSSSDAAGSSSSITESSSSSEAASSSSSVAESSSSSIAVGPFVGTWVYFSGGNDIEELTFDNNAVVELTVSGGYPMVIGTYSATEDTVTLLFNQVYGAYVHSFANLPTGTGLDTASWYSVARVLDTLKTQLTLQGKDSSQIDSILNPIETSLNAFLIPHFFSYIFNGDTLTLSGTSFIKQQ